MIPTIKSDSQFLRIQNQISKSSTLGSVLISGGGIKINGKWKMKQRVFREAIVAAKKGKL